MNVRTYITGMLALILALLSFCLCACAPKSDDKSTPSDTGDGVADSNTPNEPLSAAEASFLTFDFSTEEAFLPKNIYNDSLYTSGIVPVKSDDKYYVHVFDKEHASRTIVLQGEYGKCYEIKCPAGIKGLRAAVLSVDPRTAEAGTKIYYESNMALKYYSSRPDPTKAISFMYYARSQNSFLVLYTGNEKAEIEILERTMIQDSDTEGLWFTPATTFGGLKGGEGSFADWRWSAEEFLDNLYEPYRAKYPEYITREIIGKDQSGTYNMYGYVFTPEEYKSTLFITSGVHGDEETGYHGLAAFLSLVCDATEDGDPLLWFVRNNVRLIVIPIVNVWAASQDPTGSGPYTHGRLRYNSTKTDINRDFVDLSQAESNNVLNYFARFSHEVDLTIDCHTAAGKHYSLWFDFISSTGNAVAHFKTVNHMYHRFMQLGHIGKTPSLAKTSAGNSKTGVYLEGAIWNRYKVPSISVEHADYKIADSRYGNGDEVTLACEVYGNFIIQNALYFCNAK